MIYQKDARPEKGKNKAIAEWPTQGNQAADYVLFAGLTPVEATFKWSRDNGAIVSGCSLSGTELTVDNPRGFTENGWAELTNDGQELRGKPGTLVWV